MIAGSTFNAPTLPARAGVGAKFEHAAELLAGAPAIGFVEVHAENFMGEGGPALRFLEKLAGLYPLSIHGVGLSIGGAGALDAAHLARLKQLCDRFEPASFSEHLAWSTHDTHYLNDLLPLPYTEETLARVVEHIDQVQETLKRRMLLENPSTYVEFEQSTLGEVEFLAEIARRSGCGLLLDVNNVHVSAVNHNRDAIAFIEAFPLQAVGEIHLAGFFADQDSNGDPLLIDAHGSPVDDEVWALYEAVLARRGPVATLIEWDNDLPPFSELTREATRAARALARARRPVAA